MVDLCNKWGHYTYLAGPENFHLEVEVEGGLWVVVVNVNEELGKREGGENGPGVDWEQDGLEVEGTVWGSWLVLVKYN